LPKIVIAVAVTVTHTIYCVLELWSEVTTTNNANCLDELQYLACFGICSNRQM